MRGVSSRRQHSPTPDCRSKLVVWLCALLLVHAHTAVFCICRQLSCRDQQLPLVVTPGVVLSVSHLHSITIAPAPQLPCLPLLCTPSFSRVQLVARQALTPRDAFSQSTTRSCHQPALHLPLFAFSTAGSSWWRGESLSRAFRQYNTHCCLLCMLGAVCFHIAAINLRPTCPCLALLCT
jgi:hypothetical protein